MALPLELIDEILTYLQDDKRTLHNCSLIAKSWVFPSQKLLYARVCLYPVNYQKWQETVSPMGAEPLRHVRALKCCFFYSLYPSYGSYFGSLHRLQCLALCSITHIESGVTNLFTAFQATLWLLYLGHLSLTWGTFINLVDYFPNLRELRLIKSSFEGDHRAIPPFSRPPRGKLCLIALSSEDMSILSTVLSASELQYDELEIIKVVDQTPSHVRPILSACGKTLKHLVLDPQGCKSQCYMPSSDAINTILHKCLDSIQQSFAISLSSKIARSCANSCSLRRGRDRQCSLSSRPSLP